LTFWVYLVYNSIEVEVFIMLIYHGSNVIVETPEIFIKYRKMDFGGGFYATTDKAQAVDFTNRVEEREKRKNPNYAGKKFVSIYKVDLEKLKGELTCKVFENADEEWFDFVDENRKGIYAGKKYDVIIGPVANDNVYTTFIGYRAGTLTKQQAIEKLKAYVLVDQIFFTTQKALSYLKYVDFEEV